MNFPKDFYWGATTSSFQIEGDIVNDFTEWEKLGLFDQNGKQILYDNGSAHWNHWEQDFELISELGLNSYRFSIEWARIFPQPYIVDKSALNQYEIMIDRLIDLNIEPMLTLHHFSNPHWLHQIAPWEDENVIDHFMEFVRLVVERFHNKIKYWVTFNEPVVWALAAYAGAKFPPAKSKLSTTMDVLYNMLNAHTKAYDFIKLFNSEARVGIAKHFIVFKEGNPSSLFTKGLVNRMNQYFNKMFVESFEKNELSYNFLPFVNYKKKIQLNNKIDFWGINYYYRMHVKFRLNFRAPIFVFFKEPHTDMGWEIYPKGLKKIIRYLKETNKEIFITENGIATQDDEKRIDFITEHIKVVQHEIKKGANIKGFYYWSLLDNYEWLEGKDKRFGLIHIDYSDDFKRTIKNSGKRFMEIVRNVTEMIH